eukprot:866175-Pelagomonas_calceolata.AAC.6
MAVNEENIPRVPNAMTVCVSIYNFLPLLQTSMLVPHKQVCSFSTLSSPHRHTSLLPAVEEQNTCARKCKGGLLTKAVDGSVHNAAAVVEHVLGPIAMMDVPIHDQYTGCTRLDARRSKSKHVRCSRRAFWLKYKPCTY